MPTKGILNLPDCGEGTGPYLYLDPYHNAKLFKIGERPLLWIINTQLFTWCKPFFVIEIWTNSKICTSLLQMT